MVYINDFELRYPRSYDALDDQLSANSAAHKVVTLGAFSTADIDVFDLRDPLRPQRWSNTRIDGDDNDGYRASLRVPSSQLPLIALNPSTALSPARIIADQASRLRNTTNAAHWLLITTSDLIESAQQLAQHRRGQQLRTRIVDIEDIYDEFNHGNADPDAIWRFLRFAQRHWRAAPRYVVLAGEGSFDYNNYLGHGDSLIPTLLAPTPHGLSASDNLYANVQGNDSLPEMAIGRLPVINARELEEVSAKLIAYEASSGAWTRAITFAADAPDAAGDFPADSEAMAANVPADYLLEHINVDQFAQPADAHAQLLQSLRDGRAFCNFTGLGNSNLLTAAQVPMLDNGERLPIITALTCLAGNFGAPGQESIGEVLLLDAQAGAAAVWAPSGLSRNDGARLLGDGFYEAIFGDGERIIGDAIRAAQARFARDGGAVYLLDIYNLIGDPATVMR